MYGWYGDGMGGGWEVAMFVMMLVLLTAVIVGVVGLVRWNSGGHRGDATPSDSVATSILKERFARGEITEEEYRQKIEVIGRPK